MKVAGEELPDNGVELGLTFECAPESPSIWGVDVHASLGWSAWLSASDGPAVAAGWTAGGNCPVSVLKSGTVPLAKCGPEQPSMNVVVLVEKDLSAEPTEPDWLVVSVLFWAVEAPEIAEQQDYYFYVGSGLLTAVSEDEYIKGRMVDGPCGLMNPPVGGLAVALKESEALPPWDNPELVGAPGAAGAVSSDLFPEPQGGGGALLGVTHYAYGFVSYWDVRAQKGNELGSRRPECDGQDLTCTPLHDDCCFEGLPRIQIQLYVCTPVNCYIVETDQTDEYGFFIVQDNNWSSRNQYWLILTFLRDGYPAKMNLVEEHDGDPVVIGSSQIPMGAEYNYIPNWHINPAGDTTSPEGAWGAVWKTGHEAATAAEVEGETRHRRLLGSQNPYDMIELCTGCYVQPGAACTGGATGINVPLAEGRQGLCMLHEFGHVLHQRVVAAGEFPDGPDADHWATKAEGFCLGEAFAAFYFWLGMWDPELALGSVIRSHYAACVDTSFLPNTNDTAVLNNARWAFWNFVDTSPDDADGYGDLVDITLHDVMDALELWQSIPGSQGQNLTKDEMYFVPVQGPPCERNEDCQPGQVCRGDTNQCQSGDVHGENIRDWLYYMVQVTGGSIRNFVYTLESCLCIGTADNSYTFDGGYHND